MWVAAEEPPAVRCYFHLVSADVTLLDREGVEIPDTEWVREIIRIVEEIRSEEPELFEDASKWTIEVVDEQGRVVMKYPL